MPFFKSDDLALWTSGQWAKLNPNRRPDIHGFSTDSRDMEKDFAFVAVKGERDGHDFAADAVKNGATAVIAERELDVGVPVLVVKNSLRALQNIAKFHRLRFESPVVGITGSCGKTSTKEMLAKLTAWRNPLVTEKNYNNEIGVPLTITRIDLRQNQLAIVEAGVGAPGQMEELAKMIEPDLAIVTNVGLAHLERFGEIGNVAKEKSILPAHVAVGGWCLMHRNLLSWKAFDELKCKKAVVAPSDAPEFKADLIFRYAFVEASQEGMVGIDMCVEGGDEFYFEICEMSAGMLENSLLAAAAALMLGGKEEQIAAKLERIKPLPMRGATVSTETAKFYVDCYNASPTSMKDALAYFDKISAAARKRLFLIGDMAELGLATLRHHREIGAHLPHRDGDRAILVGANAEIYKGGMLEGGWAQADIISFAKAEDARAELEKFEGYVFVKGSRVCELERALPAKVLEKLSIVPAETEEDEEEPETEEPETRNRQPEPEEEEDDEFQEENFDEEIEDGDDEDENSPAEEDDEDEREKI